jgi:hypothetical protein
MTTGLSRAGGVRTSSEPRWHAARIQSLPANWSVVVTADAQYAFTDLLAPGCSASALNGFGAATTPRNC